MAPLKVIGAGCSRTGTDSLRTALNMLGYKTHHSKSFWEETNYSSPNDFYNAYLNRDSADWDKIYQHYDAAVNWPTVAFYKDLLVRYPNAKVILTVRSADSWYKSIRNTVYKINMETQDIGEDSFLSSYIRMSDLVSFEGLLSDPKRFEDEESVKKVYLDHIEDVKKNVPVEQLLVMELGEGWKQLCKFLEKEVPKEPYPSLNSTDAFWETVEKK